MILAERMDGDGEERWPLRAPIFDLLIGVGLSNFLCLY